MRRFVAAALLAVTLAWPAWADYHRFGIILQRTIDGDTIVATIDLGLAPLGIAAMWPDRSIRLARIDAWEMRGAERPMGLVAKAYLDILLGGCKALVADLVVAQDAFGRPVAEVFCDGLNVSDAVVAEGHAIYREY